MVNVHPVSDSWSSFWVMTASEAATSSCRDVEGCLDEMDCQQSWTHVSRVKYRLFGARGHSDIKKCPEDYIYTYICESIVVWSHTWKV